MSLLGQWEIKPSKNYPQKIASAVSADQKLFGCKYAPVGYLGQQLVNGTNHAVLAKQTILSGEDVDNVVIMFFNEKEDSMDVAMTGVSVIVNGGKQFGGTSINLTTNIPSEEMGVFKKAFEGFVGVDVKPFAFVGTKVVKGTEHKFIVTATNVYPDAKPELAICTINSLNKTVVFEPLLAGSEFGQVTMEADENGKPKLGYAFTWLK